MFEMHGRTIRISQGDTGIVTFSVEGAQLSSADRAVFTVKGSAGRLIQKVIAPEEGNLIRVPLTNEETDGWRPGLYSWDLRIVLEPKLDADGMVTDGREVITPWPPSQFEVVKVVGRI